jgi:hypothetical protein
MRSRITDPQGVHGSVWKVWVVCKEGKDRAISRLSTSKFSIGVPLAQVLYIRQYWHKGST